MERPPLIRHESRWLAARVLAASAAFNLTARAAIYAQVEVGEAELAAVSADARQATALLGTVWNAMSIDSSGKVIAYTDSQPTACGMLGPDNAFYCEHDDAIYYDEWFVAAIRSMVAEELGTDGDRAVLAILAHEWGHRIYTRLRPAAGGIPVFAELTADCLAGAALRQVARREPMTADDTAEATLAIRLLGDEPGTRAGTRAASWSPRPAPGDPAARGRAQDGLVRHGNPDERVRSFQRGLRNGAGKCMKELAAR